MKYLVELDSLGIFVKYRLFYFLKILNEIFVEYFFEFQKVKNNILSLLKENVCIKSQWKRVKSKNKSFPHPDLLLTLTTKGCDQKMIPSVSRSEPPRQGNPVNVCSRSNQS